MLYLLRRLGFVFPGILIFGEGEEGEEEREEKKIQSKIHWISWFCFNEISSTKSSLLILQGNLTKKETSRSFFLFASIFRHHLRSLRSFHPSLWGKDSWESVIQYWWDIPKHFGSLGQGNQLPQGNSTQETWRRTRRDLCWDFFWLWALYLRPPKRKGTNLWKTAGDPHFHLSSSGFGDNNGDNRDRFFKKN